MSRGGSGLSTSCLSQSRSPSVLIKPQGPGRPAVSVGCWFVFGGEAAGEGRPTAEWPAPPSPAIPRGSRRAGPMLQGRCGFHAGPGPPLLGRQHFTSKVFLPAPGPGRCTHVGTSLPSLPLPARWSILAIATSTPPLSDRGWGPHKPDSSSRPALGSPPPPPPWRDSCGLLTGGGTGVGAPPSAQDPADPSPLQLVAPGVVLPPPPTGSGRALVPVPLGRCPYPPTPRDLPCLLHQSPPHPTPRTHTSGRHHPVVPLALSPPPLPL